MLTGSSWPLLLLGLVCCLTQRHGSLSGESRKQYFYQYVSISVKEGHEEALLDGVNIVMENSKKAPGYISSVLCKEVGEGTGYAIIEKWETEEDINRDMESSVIKEFFENMKGKISVTSTKLQMLQAF